MKLLKTDGIVIKKIDHSEADRSLVLFTKNFGKININISGIRKSKKRHINGTDFFSVSTFIFYKKEEYYILSTFELVETFFCLREDLKKINISFYFLEILNSILVENETRTRLYTFVLRSLRILNKKSDPVEDLLLLSYFLIFLIKEEGIIFNIENGDYFDIENSKISEERTPYKITEIEKGIIINLLNKKMKETLKTEITIKQLKKVIYLLEIYINYHLNLKLNFKEIF